MLMTASVDVVFYQLTGTPQRTEFIVRTGKCEAERTNNRRLCYCSRYCTVEVAWQTRRSQYTTLIKYSYPLILVEILQNNIVLCPAQKQIRTLNYTCSLLPERLTDFYITFYQYLTVSPDDLTGRQSRCIQLAVGWTKVTSTQSQSPRSNPTHVYTDGTATVRRRIEAPTRDVSEACNSRNTYDL